MGVISRAIPTLLRGVSQTADSTKQADHADIQENATSSPTQGLKKRSGVQYLANLQSSTIGNVHIQAINRDTNERYIAVFGNQTIKVYDINGAEKTVSDPDGKAYLTSSNPRADFRKSKGIPTRLLINPVIPPARPSIILPIHVSSSDSL